MLNEIICNLKYCTYHDFVCFDFLFLVKDMMVTSVTLTSVGLNNLVNGINNNCNNITHSYKDAVVLNRTLTWFISPTSFLSTHC